MLIAPSWMKHYLLSFISLIFNIFLKLLLLSSLGNCHYWIINKRVFDISRFNLVFVHRRLFLLWNFHLKSFYFRFEQSNTFIFQIRELHFLVIFIYLEVFWRCKSLNLLRLMEFGRVNNTLRNIFLNWAGRIDWY